MPLMDSNMTDLKFLENLPCGAGKIRVDDSLSILFANTYFYSMIGYDKIKDTAFQDVRSFVSPAIFLDIKRVISENLARGCKDFEMRHQAIHRDGSEISLLVRCRVLEEEPGCLLCIMFDNTDFKIMETELRASEEESRLALSLSGKFCDIYEVGSRILMRNRYCADLPLEQRWMDNMPRSALEMGLIARESTEDYLQFFRDIEDGIPKGHTDVRMKNRAGNWRWYHADYLLTFDEAQAPAKAVIIYEDVSEKREMEIAYRKWETEFKERSKNSIAYYEYNLTENKLENTYDMLNVTIPEEHSQSFTSVAKYCAENLVFEDDKDMYLELFDRDTLLKAYYAGSREIRNEHRRYGSDGRVFWAMGFIQMIYDPYEKVIKAFVLITDIDSEKKEMLALKKMSQSDPLTGIYNRNAFHSEMERYLKENQGEECAFMIMDIDKFKDLNDTMGHQFGDQVLRDAAAILENTVGNYGFCGRIGGDEFVVFSFGTQISHGELGARICKNMNRTYRIGIKLSVSLGYAVCPVDGSSFQELYACADSALYRAKNTGRNKAVGYVNENAMKKVSE